MFIFICLLPFLMCHYSHGQGNNYPEFITGYDMRNFSLSEDTAVGASVYTLRGRDPDGDRVKYYISNGALSVDKDTGIVTLIKPLDRETEPILDVIITIIDDKPSNKNPNTISHRREIKITDVNDNAPVFKNTPYKFDLIENTLPFSIVYEKIFVEDLDSGLNSQVKVECDSNITPFGCELFNIKTAPVEQGKYIGVLSLKTKSINYETNSSIVLALKAVDRGGLSSTTEVIINVIDVQDEPPKFLNAPFSLNVEENTPAGVPLLDIEVRDGDATRQRPIKLEIIDDSKRYFSLSRKSNHIWTLLTSTNPIDREDPEILLSGSIYQIVLKASEMKNEFEVADFTLANVSILVKDIQDQLPTFNLKNVNIKLSEDMTNGSAVPGLNLFVSDSDGGENAKFGLVLENLDDENPATQAFQVFPTIAVGRTPVIIKIINSNLLDYENEARRVFLFNVVALQNNTRSVSRVKIQLTDANDNSPIFENSQYSIKIPEDSKPNQVIFTVQAFDHDSGDFGTIRYSIKGFGSEKFEINPQTGEISIQECENEQCLDFESQPNYSLTITAVDGGHKQSAANLLIEIIDVNDNVPKFVKNTYVSEIHESDGLITPPIVVKATDADGPEQGGGFEGIKYYIESTNLTGLTIDSVSGEVKLSKSLNLTLQRISKNQRKNLKFFSLVKAVDNGNPPLSSTARIIINLKSDRDGAPVFKNEPYIVNVKENAFPGSTIFQIKAADPDGPQELITYSITDGARDNFIIDSKTGEIKVSLEANLDKDMFGSQYEISVMATDAAMPIPLSSNTIVTIHIEDVNNKPPVFEKDGYVKYLPEKELPSTEVLRVSAIDPDEDADVKYYLIEEDTILRDKAGLEIPLIEEEIHQTFSIDHDTGMVQINKKFDQIKPSVITLKVEARDLNALDEPQSSQTEVVIYIQYRNEQNPIFAYPWDPQNKTYEVTIQEEGLIGSTILTLAAQDPITNLPITKFEKLQRSDPDNIVSVSTVSGIVTLNTRLDYDEMMIKSLNFSVKAINSNDEEIASLANVIVHVKDINDNSPIFSQDKYSASVSETVRWPHTILSVKATDKDNGDYGAIKYSSSGDGSSVFTIDQDTGKIAIKQGALLDREKKAFYHLQVTAIDGNNSSLIAHKRQTSVLVTINIIDYNDNAPTFESDEYKSIIPENAPVGFVVGTVKANDPDEGLNGKVKYQLITYGETKNENYFEIEENTGIVKVKRLLAGKGSSEPYEVHIRALDFGSPPLYTDTTYNVLIADISANDGVPRFIKPAKDEVVSINENSQPGTFVYKVEAIDADNPNTPNGKIVYKFLELSPYFEIDALSGIIMTTTRRGYQLDREVKENYTLILVASDLGSPPQESHRVLVIKVNDLDDNEPYFNRAANSEPIIFNVKEEMNVGSEIGIIRAIDKDIGVNGLIDYEIINGNDNDSFLIETNKNDASSSYNNGIIKNKKILDREKQQNYTLIIRAQNNNNKGSRFGMSKSKHYKPEDFSLIKVVIKLLNINDNPLTFEHSNYVTGVKLDIELNTELIICKAIDLDQMIDDKITYSIYNVTYIRGKTIEIDQFQVFEIDENSGSLKNTVSLRPYISGYFDIIVQAKIKHAFSQEHNVNDIAYANAKIFVLHSKDLLKLVFHKKPIEVEKIIPEFKQRFEDIVSNQINPTSLYLYDTEYYQRKDGSLDFESSSFCFQLVRTSQDIDNNKIISSTEAMKFLLSNHTIKSLFTRFGVTNIDNCLTLKPTYKMSYFELGIIIFAVLMGIISSICVWVGSSMKRSFKKKIISASVGSVLSNSIPYGIPPNPPSSFMTINNHQRIYDWQESSPQLDAVSFRSFPTLR